MSIPEDARVWGIHTMDDHLFLKENIIAIGWKDMGDLSQIGTTRDDYKEKYIKTYPDAKKGSIPTSVGMLFRFCHEMQIGDYIVFPSKTDRKINIGIVESDYYFDPLAHEYSNQRHVKWLAHEPRMAFSQGALYEVGSAMTFFMVKNYADEFLSALDKGFKKTLITYEGEDETVAATAEDIIESTKDFVLKELSRQLKGYDLEEFVADLLNAMGYRTNISAKGGDNGIDIVAYKDELPPRIVVQVKSQDSDIKGTIGMPHTVGFGLCYTYKSKLSIAADFTMQNWQNSKFFGVCDSLNNSLGAALGAEYTPNSLSPKNLWQSSSYRMGLYFNNSYINMNGGKLSVPDYGITFGVGFKPRYAKTVFNVTLQIGQRGSLKNNMVKENYYIIGVNFNLVDRWFVKSRID